MKVYLAGKIEGITYEEAFDWRNEAEDILVRAGKDVYNPGRHVPKEMKGQIITRENVEQFRKLSPNFSKELYYQDLEHLKESQVILVNLGWRSMTGTLFELGYGRRGGTMVVGFSADPYLIQHPFVRYSIDILYDSFKPALKYIIEL